MAVSMPGLPRQGKSIGYDAAVRKQWDTGQQAARHKLWGWERFPVASIPGAIGKPTVDDATLTCLPKRTTVGGKSGGPRLAWPIIPVKRFVAGRSSTCPGVRRRTAHLQKARSALANVWSWLPIERWSSLGSGRKHLLHLPVPEDWAIAGRIVGTIATNGAIFLQGLDENRRARCRWCRGLSTTRYAEPAYTYGQHQSYQPSAAHFDGFSCQSGDSTHNSAAHPTRRPHHSGPSRT
jgi:hypothetical protein